MKKYNISLHYLDKYMSIIQDNCINHSSFHGKELSTFCSEPKNLQAIHILEAKGEVRCVTPDNSDEPVAIWLEKEGTLHFFIKHEKRLSAIKGFLIGCLTGIISSVIFSVVFHMVNILIILTATQTVKIKPKIYPKQNQLSFIFSPFSCVITCSL